MSAAGAARAIRLALILAAAVSAVPMMAACSRRNAVLRAGGANGAATTLAVTGKVPDASPSWTAARGPSLDLALEAARVTVAACEGFHIGVVILDAAGTPKLYYVPDGTSGVHAYAGYRKANAALHFGMPSEQVGELIKSDAEAARRFKAGADDFMVWAGGVPIVVGGEIVGAIGVSGADPSSKDEACALAGLKAVQGRLT